MVHPEASDEWNLRVEYVQKRDAGIYECQVNTEPKINMAILLNVEGKNTYHSNLYALDTYTKPHVPFLRNSLWPLGLEFYYEEQYKCEISIYK